MRNAINLVWIRIYENEEKKKERSFGVHQIEMKIMSTRSNSFDSWPNKQQKKKEMKSGKYPLRPYLREGKLTMRQRKSSLRCFFLFLVQFISARVKYYYSNANLMRRNAFLSPKCHTRSHSNWLFSWNAYIFFSLYCSHVFFLFPSTFFLLFCVAGKKKRNYYYGTTKNAKRKKKSQPQGFIAERL